MKIPSASDTPPLNTQHFSGASGAIWPQALLQSPVAPPLGASLSRIQWGGNRVGWHELQLVCNQRGVEGMCERL